MLVEPRADTGHPDAVLAKLLADAIRAHVIRTGETERQIAVRIGMPHQNLYEFLKRAGDPTFDPGTKKMERLADAIGYELTLTPKATPEGLEKSK